MEHCSRLNLFRHHAAIFEISSLPCEMCEQTIILGPFGIAVCCKILCKSRVTLHLRMKRLELGETVKNIRHANACTDALVLVQHLKQSKVSTLRSCTTHV